MNYNLNNKKILITGASGGIGSSICQKFIENNCTIICTASNEEKLEKLKKQYGDKNFYYHLDLNDNDSLLSSIENISNEHNDIDVLVNNAGTTNDNLFLRMKKEQWNEVININLNSNFYIIKGIIPNMLKRRSGNIIGITSVVALTGNSGQANYTASKSALIGMYKSLALEFGQRNIRINTIAPGFIKTPMTDKLNETQIDSIMKKIPMQKLGESKDIANMVLFLSSDDSSYITGQTFHINGGMYMV